MNHAFLIMAYNNPDLLSRTTRLLEAENHYFFVHIDKKADLEPFRLSLNGIKNMILLSDNERIIVNWGGVSQLLAEIILLKKSLAYKNAHIDYFHLISGADFPCKSNDEIDRYFETHKGKSYMWFDSDEETTEWRKQKYPDRYRLYHFHDIGYNNNWIINVFRPIIEKVQHHHIYLRPEIKNVYAGWNWFSWHRSVVEYALCQIELHPKKLERMRYCTCIDEIFFHTMLHDDADWLGIETRNALRYIDWHPTRPAKTLPLVLDERDYTAIKESDAIFCRKVQPGVSERLLRMLEKNIRIL